MRNLKKFLALVLAMMMVFSLMVTANAADFADEDKITPAYDEAVKVLKALGVVEGDETGEFDPQGTFNRAFLAAIAYRVGSGSTAADRGDLYVDYSPFTDLAGFEWAAGYISFAWNAGWVHGESSTTFNPGGEVTGYQVLALLLQMMGYGQNGEFIGPNWRIETARIAKDLRITAGLSDTTLNSTATREVVAELVFEAMQKPMVTYLTLTNSYVPLYVDDSATKTAIVTTITPEEDEDYPYSLGYKWFGLTKSGTVTVDKWGRPGYYWFNDIDRDGTIDSNEKTYVGVEYIPVVPAYTTPVTECDIADDVNGGKNMTKVTMYTNGNITTQQNTTQKNTNLNVQTNQTITATNTKSVIGGQGRITEVYDVSATSSDDWTIVRIDTLLAKVTGVTKATFDKAGHISKYATITLEVYDRDNGGSTNVKVESKEANRDQTNWEYSKGDYVLINAWQSNANGNNNGRVYTDSSAGSSSYQSASKYVEILHEAYSEVATQNVIIRNQNQHNVGGTVYDDNNRLHLNVAGNNKGSYLWLFDDYDNVIGIDNATVAAKYGVVTYLYLDHTRGADITYADITYTDGTTDEDVIIDSVDVWDDVEGEYVTCTPVYGNTSDDVYEIKNKTVVIATDAKTNGTDSSLSNFVYRELFAVTENEDGSVNLGAVDEITNVSIKATRSRMNGLPGKDSTKYSIYVDDYTEILIRSGSGYNNWKLTDIVGFEFDDYASAAFVDYIDVDGDNVADYALIAGTPDSDTDYGLAYIMSTGGKVKVVYDTKTQVWTIPAAYIDGEEGDLKTRTPEIAEILADSPDCLFYVEYTNGYVDAIRQITAEPYQYPYATNREAVYLAGATASGRILYEGDKVAANYNPYNISSAVVFMYNDGEVIDYEDLEDYDLDECGVYVVYDPRNTNNNASFVFITDVPLGNNGNIPPKVFGIVLSLEDVENGITVEEGQHFTLVLEDDETITGNIVVEKGGSLTIIGDIDDDGGDTDITVAEGGELIVGGDVEISGKIEISDGGSMGVVGDVTASGGITVGEDGSMSVTGGDVSASGGITVGKDGSLTVEADEDGDGGNVTGDVEVEDGGELYVEGEVDGDLTVSGEGSYAEVGSVADGKAISVTGGATAVVGEDTYPPQGLSRAVALAEEPVVTPEPIEITGNITVEDGSTLIINGNVSSTAITLKGNNSLLYINGDLTSSGTVTVGDPDADSDWSILKVTGNISGADNIDVKRACALYVGGDLESPVTVYYPSDLKEIGGTQKAMIYIDNDFSVAFQESRDDRFYLGTLLPGRIYALKQEVASTTSDDDATGHNVDYYVDNEKEALAAGSLFFRSSAKNTEDLLIPTITVTVDSNSYSLTVEDPRDLSADGKFGWDDLWVGVANTGFKKVGDTGTSLSAISKGTSINITMTYSDKTLVEITGYEMTDFSS